MRTEVAYFLPVTRVRLRARVTTTTDGVLGSGEDRVEEVSLELVTLADTSRRCRLVVESGVWRDYAFSVSLTEDGRLTGAGLESTGQLGSVVAAAAGVAVAGLALATGTIPVAGLAAAGAVAAAARPAGGVGVAGLDQPAPPPVGAGSDPVADAYAAAHPGQAARLAALALERAATVRVVDQRRAAYLAAVTQPAGERDAARAGFQAAREVLADVEAELEAVKAHFAAWRAGTLTATTAVLDVLVPLEALPVLEGQALRFPSEPDAVLVQEFLARAGRVLAHPSPAPALGPAPAGTAADPGEAGLRVLRPRLVELLDVATGPGATPVVAGVHRELVMDALCEEVALPVRRSWNAKRRTDVTVSGLGALTQVSFNGASSAAGVAAAGEQVGQAVAESLERAATTRTGWDALARAGQQQELARLQDLVAIAEQRLLAAGQAATTADHTRLAQLRQTLEIAQTQAALDAATSAEKQAQP